MTAPRTCRIVTLGCKVNQYESQYVKEVLEANGYREADEGEAVDLCLVNTCTVTGEADAKGRQTIRRLAQAHPGAALIVMGCFAVRAPEVVRRLPGVTQVVAERDQLAEALRTHGITQMPAGITRFDGHQRAFVKVQDGCLLRCSYCIIPQVRPTLQSRPVEEVVAEVRGLVEHGCQEIVLTGIHLGHYGIDLSRGRPRAERQRLWHLLERLAVLPGEFRIRLSSLEAAEAGNELVPRPARLSSSLSPSAPVPAIGVRPDPGGDAPADYQCRFPGALPPPANGPGRTGPDHGRHRRLPRRKRDRLRGHLPGPARGGHM